MIIVLGLIAIIFSIGMISNTQSNFKEKVYGDDVIELTYFHWTKCPHCHKQNEFMKNVLLERYPTLRVTEYEITQPGTSTKYEEIAKDFDELPNKWNDFPGTPLSIIGERTNVGYGDDSTTGQKLIDMIEEEKARIEANWDDSTMIRTESLRSQIQ